MAWVGVITDDGADVLSQWVAGTTLNISSADAGTGTYPEVSLVRSTALVDSRQAASIINQQAVTGGYRIKLQVTPPVTGYTLQQFGVWGAVGSGTPVLIAIFQNADGITIPNAADAPDFEYSFYATLSIGNENDMQVTVDTSALVSQSTLNSAIATRIAASGGDAADAIIGSSTASTASYPVPAAGDTMKVILGKIIKFFADIVKTFTGATSGAAGAKGLVPAPSAGQQDRYLRADASWQAPINDALATTAGGVLDARMGKTLQDQITTLNDSLGRFKIVESGVMSTYSFDIPSPISSFFLIFMGDANNGALFGMAKKTNGNSGVFTIFNSIPSRFSATISGNTVTIKSESYGAMMTVMQLY